MNTDKTIHYYLIIFIICLQTAGFFSISGNAGARSQTLQERPARSNRVKGEMLVKFRPAVSVQRGKSGRVKLETMIRSKKLVKKEEIENTDLAVFEAADADAVDSLIDELRGQADIEYVQPNYIYEPDSIPGNDPQRAKLWGLDNTGQTVNGEAGKADADIDAPEAWGVSEGENSEIVIAVIDTGVAYNHPDLLGNMWDGSECRDENNAYLGGCNHGYDYEQADKTPLPTDNWHGTHIAGTIAAAKNNGIGIAGVSPRAKIMAIKTDFSTSQIVKAINFAKYNGAKIINASWGCYGSDCGSDGYNDQAMIEAIAAYPGLFINSAGNGNDDGRGDDHDQPGAVKKYPCDYPADNIICVAATDQNDNLASFSDYGAASVDVGAPGTNIYSTIPGIVYRDEIFYEDFSGTAPALPAGWSKSGNFRTLNSPDWGSVMFGDTSFPYSGGAGYSATSPRIDLHGRSSVSLSFMTMCDTQNSQYGPVDYMSLAISPDGYDYATYIQWDENSLSARSGSERIDNGVVYEFDNIIIPDDYLKSDFHFRFYWNTNSEDNNYEGCWVDNINLLEFDYNDGSGNSYAFSSGTSMAAPHVAGLAALVWGYRPGLGAPEVKSAILDNGDPLPALAGKTVTGRRINAYRSLLAVEEIAPAPPELSETTPVPSPTDDNTPAYTFSTSQSGSISYTGACTSVTNTAATGTNTIIFDTLSDGTYADCTITVINSGGIASQPLEISAFTIDTAPPDIVGLSDSEIPVKSAAWNWDSPDPTAQFRYSIDREPDGSPDGSYNNGKTAVKSTGDGTFYIHVQAIDGLGNESSVVTVSATLDNTAPALSPAAPVPSPANDDTPVFIFNSDEPGSIVYIGACGNGSAAEAVAGSNTVQYGALEDGTYSDCAITVTDQAGNANILNVNTFIIDTAAPVLTLNGENIVFHDVGREYIDPGASARDDVDGDITENIVISGEVNVYATGTYHIYYNVADSSGNKAPQVYRTVIVTDREAPTIILFDPNPMELTIGHPYNEPGFMALDGMDGDISGKVSVIGSIDTSATGTYIVTYSVTDSAGNTAAPVTRIINVIEAPLADTTPPVRSGGAPSSQLSANTTSAVISLQTGEDALCHYSKSPDVDFANSNIMATTGSISHETTIAGLSNGQSYKYYIRCQDLNGNANPEDYVISFSVANPPARSSGGGAAAGIVRRRFPRQKKPPSLPPLRMTPTPPAPKM